MNQPSLLAIIPARAGSKRIPHKNVKPLAGKPLIWHTIECALHCPGISRVIVSTDAPSIGELARDAGADVPFLRPPELAADATPTIEVILHALNWLEQNEAITYQYLAVLQPTSPLRTITDIETAFALLCSSPAQSIVSVTGAPIEGDHLVRIEGGTVRLSSGPEANQDFYKLNGAIYISRTKTILATGHLSGGTVIPYYMPGSRSIDIDTPDDFQMAEALVALNCGGDFHGHAQGGD